MYRVQKAQSESIDPLYLDTICICHELKICAPQKDKELKICRHCFELVLPFIFLAICFSGGSRISR
jgi:hypothetical protein